MIGSQSTVTRHIRQTAKERLDIITYEAYSVMNKDRPLFYAKYSVVPYVYMRSTNFTEGVKGKMSS